jgi:hypothetical protein
MERVLPWAWLPALYAAIEVPPKPQRRAGLSPVEVYRAAPIERGAHEGRPSSTALSGIGPSHSSSGGSLSSR